MNNICHILQQECVTKEHGLLLKRSGKVFTEYSQSPDILGMKGEPRPEHLYSDPAIIIPLLLCFILFCHALKKAKVSLKQQMSDFIQHKEHNHHYHLSLKPDIRYFTILTGISCVLCGIWFFHYFTSTNIPLSHQVSHEILLSIYTILIALLYCCKYTLYRFINWIFFDKEQNKTWLKGYIFLHAGISIILFPFIITIIFSHLNLNISLLIATVIYICCKILLFYKSFKNFFYNLYGAIHLILYFCALEIVPDFLLWKVMEYINSISNFNFLLH